MNGATPEPTTMLDLIGPLWSRDRARDALNVSDPDFDDLVAAGEVLRLPASDDPAADFYPVFQFVTAPTGDVQVRPALQGLLQALAGHDPWTIATLLLTPAPELDDLTPVEAARTGYSKDALLAFAEAIKGETRTGVAG